MNHNKLLCRGVVLLIFAITITSCGAIDKLGQYLDKATDTGTLNARELTNQFGALVGDLYDPTHPDRQERARAIFKGVLGRDLMANERPAFEYSIVLAGNSKEHLDVDSYLLSNRDDESLQAVFADGTVAFKPTRLNGSPLLQTTDKDIRDNVVAAARYYIEHRQAPAPRIWTPGFWNGMQLNFDSQAKLGNISCAPVDQNDPLTHMVCGQVQADGPIHCYNPLGCYPEMALRYDANMLADVIFGLELVPPATPYSTRLTENAPGGIVAVVVRQKDVEELLSNGSNPELHLWVHEADHPEIPIKAFQLEPPSRSIAYQPITLRDLANEKHCFVADSAGKLCYAWVDLRLMDFRPAVPMALAPTPMTAYVIRAAIMVLGVAFAMFVLIFALKSALVLAARLGRRA